MNKKYLDLLQSNFFRYLSVSSQSLASNTVLPSSEGQRELALVLVEELKELGLKDVHIDEHAIVTALLKGDKAQAPKVGYIAHLDTVDVNLSPNISPQILNFKGDALVLNKEKNIVLDPKDHPELNKYLNEDIIFSDGTSVLGADNKAAISTIMTSLQYLIDNKVSHGDLYIAFVPDEEIGLRGAKKLDLTRFPVDFAYTIDCCEIGEVVYENFNACSASIEIQGVAAHPMSAIGVLVNPLLIAVDIINEFDRKQTPECTQNKEGYIWQTDLTSNPSTATLNMAIRDFDKVAFAEKKSFIKSVIEKTRKQYPKAVIEYTITDWYSNIADSLTEDRRSLDTILECMKDLSIPINVLPMRGGTDGAALSAKNIPTPNYFTGAHNFHSNFEFLPISSFEKSLELTVAIIQKVSTL